MLTFSAEKNDLEIEHYSSDIYIRYEYTYVLKGLLLSTKRGKKIKCREPEALRLR